MIFNSLRLIKLVHETSDAVSLYFDVPDNLKTDYNFIPGQYLTLSIEINGKEVRRAYSIFTSPNSGDLGVTVKKIDGGKMSSFIHDSLKEGQSINTSTPEGKFVIKPEDKTRNHYFITAGSGITPIMSMIPHLLEVEPLSSCYLLYGNRDEDHIIFKEKLDELQSKYKGQLFVTYTLSKPKKQKGVFGIFKAKSTWHGKKGRIDAQKIESFIGGINQNDSSIFYLCGPGDLIETTEVHLKGRGVAAENIKTEHFTTKTTLNIEQAESNIATNEITSAKIITHLDGETIEFTTNGKKTILDELLDLKKNPPYSCTSGACSSCMAKVLRGSVKMEACYALDEGEIADNYILTCQARTTSKEVEITYEV